MAERQVNSLEEESRDSTSLVNLSEASEIAQELGVIGIDSPIRTRSRRETTRDSEGSLDANRSTYLTDIISEILTLSADDT